MKRVVIFGVVFSLMGIMFNASVFAMRVSPNTGTFAPLSEQTVAIIGSPTVANAKGAKIRLTISGATISPYGYDDDGNPYYFSTQVSSNNGYLSIGTCTGSTFTTATQVCVDIVRTNDGEGNPRYIQEGNILGEFKIKFNSGATSATIVTGSDSAYLVGSDLIYNNGQTLGTYTIGTPATPTLPVAGISDSPFFALFVGVGIVALGVAFFLWRDKLQKSYN